MAKLTALYFTVNWHLTRYSKITLQNCIIKEESTIKNFYFLNFKIKPFFLIYITVPSHEQTGVLEKLCWGKLQSSPFPYSCLLQLILAIVHIIFLHYVTQTQGCSYCLHCYFLADDYIYVITHPLYSFWKCSSEHAVLQLGKNIFPSFLTKQVGHYKLSS